MVILVVMALAKESFLTIGNSAKKLILLKVVNFGHGTGLIASKNTIINIINNF
jgi:hypothetical protein